MMIPDSARPRLAKIVRMLSGEPGDVVAAATALRATLGGVGCDLHDLAAEIEQGTQTAAQMLDAYRQAEQARRQANRTPPEAYQQAPQRWSREDREKVLPFLRWGFDHCSMTLRERAFVDHMIQQFETKPSRDLSRAQESWLTTILQKIVKAQEGSGLNVRAEDLDA